MTGLSPEFAYLEFWVAQLSRLNHQMRKAGLSEAERLHVLGVAEILLEREDAAADGHAWDLDWPPPAA